MTNPTFEQLTEEIPDHLKPAVFRQSVGQLTPTQHHFRKHGYVILRNFIDHDLIDAYCARFIRDRHKDDWKYASSPVTNGKWRPTVPYMEVEEIRDLCCDNKLMGVLKHLIGYEMGLHLNLIEWVSTERDWHADDYLNPEHVNNHYLAVWFALDTINPQSGPFQFIDASHNWPIMRRQRVWDAAPPSMKALPTWNDAWPSLTQGFVSAAYDKKIEDEGLKVSEFIPAEKGDVLIWSGSLVHRGSAPLVRGMERRALISHYSSIHHRKDMPITSQHKDQGTYFVL